MDTLVANLRRFADALESGAIEAPDLVMVVRTYNSIDDGPERTAMDYIDPHYRGAQAAWCEPREACRGPYSATTPDDGN